MLYIIRHLACAVFLVAPLGIFFPLLALADDEDLRAGSLQPRTGVVSDEVILRKLRVLGLHNTEIVRRDPDGIKVEGEIDLMLDPMTGAPLEMEQSGPGVLPQTPDIDLSDPIISDRDAIIDPRLMNGAVRIER